MDSEQEGDISLDISLSNLNDSIDEDAVASTPKKQKVTRSRKPAPGPFKKPASVPKPKGPVLAKCSKCGAEYRTLRYYNRHLQGHQLKELASRVPDVHSIETKCQEIAAKSIDVLLDKPVVYGKIGAEFQELVSAVKMHLDLQEWKEFVAFLVKRFCVLLSAEKFCMPSALLLTELSVVDNILSTVSDREYLLLKLSAIANCDENVCDMFLCEFVFTFADQLVIFIFRCLRNADGNPRRESAVDFDSETRQCVFFVGGSIFHGYRMFGARYSASLKWKKIVEVIDNKILEDDFYEALENDKESEQHKEDRLWTEQKNRGGLNFVKAPVQSFLLSVLKIMVEEKQPDGSVPIPEILNKVVVSDPKFEWDNAIGNSLNEDLSLTLMIGVTKKLLGTYAKGEIKRILNTTNPNGAVVSITLRHKVAPKK